ncbi:hypothetical protein Sm713_17070 [Streptomyces sp. TS71-3]|nr:hypothetical protein Sm713_17070 [Streptomyces sp. TS71-3]
MRLSTEQMSSSRKETASGAETSRRRRSAEAVLRSTGHLRWECGRPRKAGAGVPGPGAGTGVLGVPSRTCEYGHKQVHSDAATAGCGAQGASHRIVPRIGRRMGQRS